MKETPVAERPGCGCVSLLALALAGLAALALVYGLLRAAGAFLITGDRLKAADAVAVLGGGDQQRVVQAVRLVQQQYGKWLIVTEVGEVKPGQGPGSRSVQAQAEEAGLSPFVILVTPGISTSTYDEAYAVMELMRTSGFQSVLVVTDPYHTYRTGRIFRDVFRGSGLAVRVYPVQGHWYRSDTWYLSAEGWATTLREYVKLAGYLLGYHQDR